MTVKTITIDLEAYEALSSHKQAGSRSPRSSRSGSRRAGRALAVLRDRVTLSEETLDAIDAVIEERRRDPARPVALTPSSSPCQLLQSQRHDGDERMPTQDGRSESVNKEVIPPLSPVRSLIG